MKLLTNKYFKKYNEINGLKIEKPLTEFDFGEANVSLGYQTQASAVFSSNIEGNTVDLNTFMNYKLSKDKFKPSKEIDEIENLINAYEFAQNNILNETNFLTCHKILSQTLLIKSKRGKYRNEPVGVFGKSGMVYLAIEPEFVEEKMGELFSKIDTLLKTKLSIEETFYYSSFIHLNIAHIHPFMDGNGRAERLIEKWFLTSKTKSDLWKVPSEQFYKEHQPGYYNALNLGINYYELNYDKCIPFLIMLPNAVSN